MEVMRIVLFGVDYHIVPAVAKCCHMGVVVIMVINCRASLYLLPIYLVIATAGGGGEEVADPMRRRCEVADPVRQRREVAAQWRGSTGGGGATAA